jgi:HSP20 family protein
VFSRQLILGDNLDLDKITASYHDGMVRLVIPVAERAKPRKISVDTPADERRTLQYGTIEGGTASELQDTSQQAVTVS